MHIFSGVEFQQTSKTSAQLTLGRLPPLLLQDLLPKEIQWLERLVGQVPNEPTFENSLLVPPTISLRSQNKLESLLIQGGFAQKDTRFSEGLTPHELAEYAALTARNLPAEECLKKRKEAVVAVHGINRVSLAMIRTLCTSGITKFVIDDSQPFDSVELQADHFYPKIGPSRAESVQSMLRSIEPRAMVLSPHNYVSLAVLSSTTENNLLASAQMTLHSLPHLVITMHASSTVVGPMFSIDSEHELSCLGLRSDTRSTATSSAGSRLHKTSVTKTPLFSSLDATTIGTFAASQILDHLDGNMPVTASTHAVFQLGTALAELSPIVIPAGCSCIFAIC